MGQVLKALHSTLHYYISPTDENDMTMSNRNANEKLHMRALQTHHETKRFILPSNIKNWFEQLVSMTIKNGKELDQDTFIYLVERYSYDACEIYAKGGANINSTYRYIETSETLAHCAVRQNSYAKLLLCLAYGAHTSVQWQDMDLLQYAIHLGCQPYILHLLGTRTTMDRIKQSLRDFCAIGETPLTCATRLGVISWVRLLATSAEDVLETDGTGLNAMHISHKDPNLKMVLLGIVKSNDVEVNQNMLEEAGFDYQEALRQTVRLHANYDESSYKEFEDWYGYVNDCTTNIRPHKTVRSMSRAEFETLIRRSVDNSSENCPETREIREGVRSIVQQVSDEMSSNAATQQFAFTMQFAGSSTEGTKTFMPDEYDVICKLDSPDIYVDSNGEVRVKVTQHQWNHLLLPEREHEREQHVLSPISPQKFADAFNKAFANALINITTRPNLHLFARSLEIRDKIACLCLLWRSNRFKDMIIHVDIVPAISLEGNVERLIPEKDRRLPLGETSVSYHLIPKISRHSEPFHQRFQVSHSKAGNEAIANFRADINKGLLVAKALRITKVSCPEYIDSLQLEESVSSEDFITSYMLKTCLFHVLDECNLEQLPYNEYVWADKIYEKLESFLENTGIPLFHKGYIQTSNMGKVLPTGTTSLFECKQDDPGVCLKKNLMLHLCKNIRKWLKANNFV